MISIEESAIIVFMETKTENPEKQEIIRDELGRFPKGVSGNPKGRPEGITITGRIRQIFAEDPKLFEKTVREYMKDEKARDLMWRMIDGNPKQQTDVTSNGDSIIFKVSRSNAND